MMIRGTLFQILAYNMPQAGAPPEMTDCGCGMGVVKSGVDWSQEYEALLGAGEAQ